MTSLREKMKQEMTLRGLCEGTQAQYLRSVIQLYNHYSRSPAKLNETEVKNYLLHLLSNASYAASTYNVMVHGLKFFYEFVLNRPVLANIPRIKGSQKLPDILSPSEVEQIIKAARNLKYRTILILIYGAGLRASEAAKLRVKDIDSTRGLLHIREGKGNKDRYVSLSPRMLNTLRFYWKNGRVNAPSGGESDFIFWGQSGEPLSGASIGAMYKQSKKAAGITKQGGVHALRHAYATHALEAGADLFSVKEALGHSSITSTVRYLRMTDKLRTIQSPIEQLDL